MAMAMVMDTAMVMDNSYTVTLQEKAIIPDWADPKEADMVMVTDMVTDTVAFMFAYSLYPTYHH